MRLKMEHTRNQNLDVPLWMIMTKSGHAVRLTLVDLYQAPYSRC